MPRQARKKSESQIYHVMLRGINQQQIFEDDEDHWNFLKVVEECKAVSVEQEDVLLFSDLPVSPNRSWEN